MKERIFQLLNVEHGEESMVSMLLMQSVFLGIFYGAFDISAHSLFLSVFDEKAMAKAYVASGFAGIILTGLYTWLQARLRFKNFAIANLVFVTLFTLFLWIALIISPEKMANWVIISVFVMLGPLNILAMLGFWGTTGRLFSLRQGKRLFGLVDAGLVIGIIISCYAIPVLLAVHFKSHNILLISSGSMLVAAVIQILIGGRFTFTRDKAEKAESKKSSFSMFKDSPYIRIMGAFVALSVMTAFFIMYSFMAVTRVQYAAEADMARFLGLFTGSMMIFTLLIKILAFSYLIRNYGLKTCLALSPFLIAGFTAIAIVVGMLMGYTPAAPSGFIIFFLLMALSRLFSKSLKDSIESPAFKVIYQTVDEKVRYEVQSGIDGTVNEMAALSSGILLAGLGALSFIKLIHFSWVLFIIILGWIILALKLYSEYRGSIRKSLEAVGTTDTSVSNNRIISNLKNRVAGNELFRHEYFNIITGNLTSLEHSENKWFLNKVIGHARSFQDLSLMPALKKIAENRDVEEVYRHNAIEVNDEIETTKGDTRKLDQKGHIKADEEKLIAARKTLSGDRLPQTTEILRLLRDNNIESKRYAIYMIGKFRIRDMISEVCECLAIPGLETEASSVLSSFGSDASEDLQRFYLNSTGSLNTSKHILRLLGKLNTRENNIFLFARLWSNSRQVKEVALKSLIDCGFKANAEEKDKLNQLISDIIGMITWNISAQLSLTKANDKILLEVIQKETFTWNSFLFNLLSITYDSGSVSKIRANIETGTVEGVNYALEMIDIVIDESIKAKLVSLVDVVPDEEKLKNLHTFYPGEVPSYDNLIEDILNRDYNLISIWAKAFTLRHLDVISGEHLKETVFALLFSPEKILQEEAASLIGRTDKNLFGEILHRLPKGEAKWLGNIISGNATSEGSLYAKVTFLTRLFDHIPEDELLLLAGSVQYHKPEGLRTKTGLPDSIIWILQPDFTILESFGVFEANLSELNEQKSFAADVFIYMLPFSGLEEFRKSFPDNSFEIYNYIDLQVKNA
jgi:ATP:ADP antiporter, AAA family